MGRKSTGTKKAGRPPTGQVKWRRNLKVPGTYCWHARFTINGERTKFGALSAKIPEHDREGALEGARVALAFLLGGGAVSDSIKETVEEYSKRWLADRVGRVSSIRDDRSRIRDHVLPVIGPLDVSKFTRDDVETLRDALDVKISKGELSWKTVECVWTLVTSMCGDMVNAKKRELRARDDNPCRDVKPPERGNRKAKQYLYPSEFLAFVSCDRVPLRWRRAVALAIYTYTRDAELRELRWAGDVDLAHGVLSITRALERRTGAVKTTKSGETRRFSLEPNLLPLLRALHERAGGAGHVFSIDATHFSRTFRRWLTVAGVTRAELHHGTATSKAITWHDLRATGATWMAVRGDDPLKIKQRCGHASFSTTEIYIREAEAVREGFGEVFPPLPAGLLEFGILSDQSQTPETIEPEKSDLESGTRGSNSRPSAWEADALPTELVPQRAA
jgi:integrase